jgi:4-carboxymuconolactone decarboxylase
MCVLANLEIPQFGAHVRGTFNAGYSKEKIMAAVAQCMPYMGTPRTLNAVRIVNETLTEEG